MIKVVSLLRRQPHINTDQFTDFWTRDWRKTAAAMPGLRGFRQCISANLEDVPFGRPSPFDGLDEFWFDNKQVAEAALGEFHSSDADKYIDTSAGLRISVREHIIIEGFSMRPGRDAKLTFFFRHHPDLTHQAARDHWYTIHAPLVPGTPGVIRYVQGHSLDDSTSFWSGTSDLWFRDLSVLPQFAESPQIAEQAQDGPYFSDFNHVELYVACREEVVC